MDFWNYWICGFFAFGLGFLIFGFLVLLNSFIVSVFDMVYEMVFLMVAEVLGFFGCFGVFEMIFLGLIRLLGVFEMEF